MTTAYTPILKLALPVTGELNGTWGDVVNQNITSMVEQAIAGLATINSWTANSHTLTTADGTTSESRCAMLVADDDGAGNPSAAATIICPNSSKLYIVKNISGQTVTLKTAAGTGIAVPNNQTSFLFCDGTNVESCVTSIVDGNVAGNLTVQGNATVNGNTTLGNATTDTVTLTARVASVVSPSADNTYDLGSVANSWKDLYIDGTAYLALVDINGGAIDGTTIGATTPSTVIATQVDIVAQGDLRLQDTTGGEYVALQAPGTLASSYTLTLPVDDGTAGQALITDGSGVLSWSSAASGDVYGPASATDNAVARYDGTTGKIIQNSAVTIADDGATVIAANSTSDGLRITQLGTGNALVVEDSTNPDATPFVVNGDGTVLVRYGTAVSTNVGGTPVTPVLQSFDNGSGGLGLFRYAASTSPAAAYFAKSRSATTGTIGSIVQSGDALLRLSAAGDDGTQFTEAARISVEVDGTPGTNDMPGRLVFSTTADGASSPTERMRIDNQGRVGIGASPTSGLILQVGKNPADGAYSDSVYVNGTIQSNVTARSASYVSNTSVANAAFTLSSWMHFGAYQGTKGASATVTNQYGFSADSSLTGATNNYGFYSNIASGTGRWNFYANGTADNYFAGKVGVGMVPSNQLDVSASTYCAVGVTSGSVQGQIAANSGGSVDVRAVSNHAVILYSNNTERMRITNAGVISLGAAPGSESLRVTPVASAVNYFEMAGATTGGAVSLYSQGSDANIWINYRVKGAGVHQFITDSAGTPATQFRIAHTASAVNYLQATGGATGNAVILSAQGSDANVPMSLVSKGTGDIRFTTNASERMRIDSAGNVGIGTTNPYSRFNVSQSSTDTTNYYSGARVTITNSSATTNNFGTLSFTTSAGNDAAAIWTVIGSHTAGSASGALVFGTTNASSVATERMRITSAGDVGIGTSSPGAKLDVVGAPAGSFGTIRAAHPGNTSFGVVILAETTSGTDDPAIAIRNYNGGSPVSYGLVCKDDGSLAFNSGINPAGTFGTERMRLDSSGNLGLGVTPSAWAAGHKALQFSGNASLSGVGNSTLLAQNYYTDGTTKYIANGYAALYEQNKGDGGHKWYTAPSGTAGNAISFTQAMTLLANGSLLLGTTTTGYQNNNSFMWDAPGFYTVTNHSGTSSGTGYALFGYNGSEIGSIKQNGTTAVAYNTTSDYRLKENVTPLTGALARVAALKPCTYTWKSAPDEIGEGFLAHELQEVCPLAVTGEKDAVNEDGSIKPQSIDTSFLVATLTAAIQELKAEFDAYKAAHP